MKTYLITYAAKLFSGHTIISADNTEAAIAAFVAQGYSARMLRGIVEVTDEDQG
jgi:hypothetical protein